MARKVKDNRFTIIASSVKDEDTGEIDVECRADYIVYCDCDCGLEENKSLQLELTSEEKNAIKSFGAGVLADIRQMEET